MANGDAIGGGDPWIPGRRPGAPAAAPTPAPAASGATSGTPAASGDPWVPGSRPAGAEAKLTSPTGPAAPDYGALPPGTGFTPGAELREEKTNYPVEAAKQIIGAAGYYGGGLVGGIAGAPVAAATGPAAPVTEYGIVRAGEATGGTIADTANAVIDHFTYGTQLNISAKSLLKDWFINLATSIGFERALKLLPGTISMMTGWGRAQDLTQQVAELGERGKREFGQTLAEGQESMARRATKAETEAQKEIAGSTREQQAELAKGHAAKQSEIRQQMVENEFGATPETVAAKKVSPQVEVAGLEGTGIKGPSPEFMQQQQGLRDVYFNTKKKISDSFGKAFNDTLAPIAENPVTDVSDMHTQLLHEIQYAKEHPDATSPAMRRGIAYMKRMFGMQLTEEEAAHLAESGGQSVIDTAGGAQKVKVGPGVQPGDPLVLKPDEIPRLKNLVALKSYFGRAAMEASSEADRKALSLLDSSVDKSINKAGMTPEIRAKWDTLGKGYRQFRDEFTPSIGGKISEAENPLISGNEIWKNPGLAARLAANAPDQASKDLMRESLGDWMAQNPDRLTRLSEADANAYANAFRHLNPESRLANPKSFYYLSQELPRIEADPVKVAQVQQGLRGTMLDIQRDGAKEFVTWGEKRLAKMGAVGQNKLAEIEAKSGDPMGQFKIVQEFFGQERTGQDLVKDVAGTQKWFSGTLQAQELVGAPATQGTWATRMAQRPGMGKYYAATYALGQMAGHASAFWGVMGTVSGLSWANRSMTGAIFKAMTEEQSARIMTSIANGGYRMLGSDLARSITQSLGNQIIKAGAGNPLEPETDGSGKPNIGPMSKAIERNQATQIASDTRRIDPGHVDHVQGLNKQIASRESPNVQQDLNTGRLSQGEVRKMVDATPPGANALFQGMSLPDAMEAFQRGTDHEKQIGLAALAQKLNDEGRNLSPLQRRQMMAQLRNALPQGEGEAVG